jgi:hypothetical protein
LEGLVKAAALPISLIIALGLSVPPVAAQEGAVVAGETVCLRLTSEQPLTTLEPAELGQLLVEGDASVEIIEDEACASEAPREEPGAASGTPYVAFVAHGAGAAIELAALAERHEGADTLRQVDAAARSLAAWARQQRRWLDNHPPQVCYEAVHRQWRKGVVQVRKGARAVRLSISTLKPAPMRRAVRQLTAGAQNLVEVDLDEIGQVCAMAE